MKLSSLDLSNCLYDPNKSSLLNDMKHIPEFDVVLSYNLPKKKVVTYLILIYDVSSPLRKEVRDLAARKLAALEMAGFKQEKNGRFLRPVELILEGKNQDFNSMVVKYLSLLNDPSWTQLIVCEQMLYMETAKAMNGAYKDAGKMSKNIDDLAAKKTRLVESIIGGKEEAEPILASIYKQVTKGLDVSPEKVSTFIMESGDVPEDWNPYSTWKDDVIEDKYEVDKIKYVGDK